LKAEYTTQEEMEMGDFFLIDKETGKARLYDIEKDGAVKMIIQGHSMLIPDKNKVVGLIVDHKIEKWQIIRQGIHFVIDPKEIKIPKPIKTIEGEYDIRKLFE